MLGRNSVPGEQRDASLDVHSVELIEVVVAEQFEDFSHVLSDSHTLQQRDVLVKDSVSHIVVPTLDR